MQVGLRPVVRNEGVGFEMMVKSFLVFGDLDRLRSGKHVGLSSFRAEQPPERGLVQTRPTNVRRGGLMRGIIDGGGIEHRPVELKDESQSSFFRAATLAAV